MEEPGALCPTERDKTNEVGGKAQRREERRTRKRSGKEKMLKTKVVTG
jgi:hypothetical protein